MSATAYCTTRWGGLEWGDESLESLQFATSSRRLHGSVSRYPLLTPLLPGFKLFGNDLTYSLSLSSSHCSLLFRNTLPHSGTGLRFGELWCACAISFALAITTTTTIIIHHHEPLSSPSSLSILLSKISNNSNEFHFLK